MFSGRLEINSLLFLVLAVFHHQLTSVDAGRIRREEPQEPQELLEPRKCACDEILR